MFMTIQFRGDVGGDVVLLSQVYRVQNLIFCLQKTPEGDQEISFDHWFHVRVQTLARSDGITQIQLIPHPFGMISDLLFTDLDFMFTRPERVPPEVWVIGSVQE